jgi:hypothetical protein
MLRRPSLGRSQPFEKIVERIDSLAQVDLLRCPLAYVKDEDERSWQLRSFCTGLLTGVMHPTEHFEQLDDKLSNLLSYPLKPSDQAPESSALATQDSIHQVEHLLSRLPKVPQLRFSLPLSNRLLQKEGMTLWEGIKSGKWASKYAVPELQSKLQLQPSEDPEALLTLLKNIQDLAWDNLYVTKVVDSNTLVLATMFAKQGDYPDTILAQRSFEYVNLLSELVDQYQSICDAVAFGITAPFEDPSDAGQAQKSALFPPVDEDHEQARAIVKVFLWSAWQRSVMLHFYYVIGVQLSHGYSSIWNSFLAIRGVRELMFVSRDVYRGDHTDYLCNWAFEILRTSRTSVGLDFRHMISMFDAQFRGLDGRCNPDSTHACEGGQPDSCQRFTGAETAAQSAHSHSCDRNCKRIFWSASSYLDCPKPAAVAADGGARALTYIHVGSKTLAISHVWSHGQGGRPESGINSCLHQRYCRLACQFNCASYWIDAACIPSDLTLRRQAINNISNIFAAAKVTLVIDADIQSILVSAPHPTIAQVETLVSTLLVCDWSVRGWTMLEAIRGSRAIFLACKDDRIINLREALMNLHKSGAIDIAVLLGSAQHLIPHADPSSTKTVEEAGYILSQRHTSWPEDTTICWTLLMNAPVKREAVDLWRTQSKVRTGYLVSSAPRVNNAEGFGWAPSSPYIRPIARSVELGDGRKQEFSICVPSYDGDGSLCAEITAQGLRGKWRAISIDRSLLEDYEELCCEKMPDPVAYQADEVDIENADMLFSHPDDALAWLKIANLLTRGAEVRLLRPLADDAVSPYVGSSQRGHEFGLAAVICASTDMGLTWEWEGVFSWQESENYVGWEIKEMLIV